MKWRRTHECGEIRLTDDGASTVLCGWVDSWRDHGGVIFIDLRDRTGIAQVVFNPEHNANAHTIADSLRNEFVIAVKGAVRPRPAESLNPNLPTGEVEVLADEIEVLNAADTPPFQIDDELQVHEDLRLKYRFLDLRRPRMQRIFKLRHQVLQTARQYFDELGFYEIETPDVLTSEAWAGAVEAGRWSGEVRPYTFNRSHVLRKVAD